MSKVTGVPMVELAVAISLGDRLVDLGWPGGHLEPPPFVAVKAPAFSTMKLRGVDPSVGPGMQSTGEVIGIHTDPRVAMAKALVGASLVPPRVGVDSEGPEPIALLSIADRDKGQLIDLARALRKAGYRLAATPGTRTILREAGFGVTPVAKLGAEPDAAIGELGIIEAIGAGDVRLVVNTPTPRSGAVRDALEIRLAATSEGILCLTAIETAVAAAEALDPAIAARLSDVRSLGDWVPHPGAPPEAASDSADGEPVAVGAGG
jgi:carbamoyl-phosphate synthase large subunit